MFSCLGPVLEATWPPFVLLNSATMSHWLTRDRQEALASTAAVSHSKRCFLLVSAIITIVRKNWWQWVSPRKRSHLTGPGCRYGSRVWLIAWQTAYAGWS